MFTHLVLLKTDPYYIYCTTESQAKFEAEKFSDDVVGVAHSPEGIQVMSIVTDVRFEPQKPKEVAQLVQIDEDTFQELPKDGVPSLLDEDEIDDILKND
jgi:hypothetical protein